MRHGAHSPEATSRPSNPFRCASACLSCGTVYSNANQSRHTFRLRGASAAAMWRWRFVKNSNEHRRDVLQEIFRFAMLEKRRVLLQFVGDLVNDENAVRRERIVRFPKERPFLLDLENAKRYARKDVITGSDAVAFQFEWQRRRITMDHMNACI